LNQQKKPIKVNMLKTTIAGLELECCLYNASGPRTGSMEALQKIAESKAGAVVSKSATLEKQNGNTLPRFVNKIALGNYCDGAINSEGLPNAGINYCK
jgi:dihydroorotate dehydrogenase (fumarate)